MHEAFPSSSLYVPLSQHVLLGAALEQEPLVLGHVQALPISTRSDVDSV